MPTMMHRRRRSSNANKATDHHGTASPPLVMQQQSQQRPPLSPKVQVRTKVLCTSTELDELKAQSLQAVVDRWGDENMKDVLDLWKLTPEDESRLRDLQHRLQDVDHFKNDPHIVLRYMTAPSGYKAAEGLFRRMVEWRLENNIDDLLDEYKPQQLLLDYNPTAILNGLDREGDPIYVERGGATDGAGLLKRFTKEELLRHAIWMRELNTQGAWLDDYEQRQGHKVKDVTVVYDLKGLSSRHLNPKVLDVFKDIMMLTQERYPGPIKRMIIIRCPAILRVGWSLVKHIFPVEAREKMIFAGKGNYLKILDNYMDLDVLPPCIYEGGRGEVAIGMPARLEGGIIPDHMQREDVPPSLLKPSSPSGSAKTFRTYESFEGTEQEFLSDQSDLDCDLF